ncbi:MAG: long-chain-fatty-acid--CoA ligase [Myxococcota bacterium]
METPLTPLEFMRRSRRLYADREAVVDGADRWTYRQWFDRCDRWSAVLQRTFGVRPGDRVAYVAPNTHAELEAFYAVPQLGAVLVPINYRLTADDFVYIIVHSGATIVCAHPDYVDALESVRAQLPNVRAFVALGGPIRDGWVDYEQAVASSDGVFDRPEIRETDLLTINYTSGTTARPKGVMITHRNAYLNAVGTMVHVHLTPAVRYLWTLPMFHANGWTFTWIVTAVGGTHVCLPRVEPARIFDALVAESITVLCAAPTVLIAIANADDAGRSQAPRGIRVLTAGAPPAAATIARIEGELGWDITHVYGLTETAPFITVCEPRPEHLALAPADRAVVKARQGVELITSGELRVLDDDGREVAWDGASIGEIVVRGNVVMKGYYDDPDATATAFAGGWFHSGDAAVVHPDGFVEVRDRIKDVIISGGENISSVEVEGLLLRHPAVQEVAVVGMPHERWGETPHAFVILRAGAAATDDELRTFVRAHLAHFKCPTAFRFVTELPKTATGKIQKYVLRGRHSAITAQ